MAISSLSQSSGNIPTFARLGNNISWQTFSTTGFGNASVSLAAGTYAIENSTGDEIYEFRSGGTGGALVATAYGYKDTYVKLNSSIDTIVYKTFPRTWTLARLSNISSQVSRMSFAASGSTAVIGVATNNGTNNIYSSSDGMSFTGRSSIASTLIVDVAFGNNIFVALTNNATNNIWSSSDGATWTVRTNPQSANGALYSIAHNGSNFYAQTQSGSWGATSTDGINWTAQNHTNINSTGFNLVRAGNGVFLATGSGNNTGNTNSAPNYAIASSSGGVGSWTGGSVWDTSITGLAYGNGVWVAQLMYNSSTPSKIARSYAADPWNYDTFGWHIAQVPLIGQNFVGASTSGIPNNTSYTAGYSTVAFGGGLFMLTNYQVATQEGSVVSFSPDGFEWRTIPVPSAFRTNSPAISPLGYFNNRWLVGFNFGWYAYSSGRANTIFAVYSTGVS